MTELKDKTNTSIDSGKNVQIVQFILFGILGLFATFLLVSGAITYLFYSLSGSTEILPFVVPSWQELPKISREAFIAGVVILAAVWVLIGEEVGRKRDVNPDQKKGRGRRNSKDD